MYLAISGALLLIILLVALLARRFKLPFAHRIIHVRSVLAAIALGVAAVFLFSRILSLLNLVFSIGFIRQFLYSIMPGANVSSGLLWMITLVLNLLLASAYCLGMFLICKLWLKPVSKKPYLSTKNPITRVFNFIGSLFYNLDSGAAEIKPIGAVVGNWIRHMRNVFAAMLIVESLAIPAYIHFQLSFIDEALFASIVKSLYMIPMVSYFVLDQIVIMLQAAADNDELLLETEENGLTHFGDLSRLAELYRKLFGGDALIDDIVNNNIQEQEMFSGVSSEQLDRVDNPELLSSICRNINNLVQPMASNYIDAVVDLINGDSVAVFDSLSSEFLFYYLAFLQKELFLRRKAMVVCENEEQVAGLKEQFEDIFLRMNKVHSIWTINDISGVGTDDSNTDILILTDRQLLDAPIKDKYPDFYAGLYNILVFDPYEKLCRSTSFVFRFFNTLKKENDGVRYAFILPQNNRDIGVALKNHLDGIEIKHYNSLRERTGVIIMSWRGESYYKTQHAIALDLYHDFGLGYTLSLIALNSGVPRISIQAPGSIPLKSYAATVKNYSASIVKHYLLKDSLNVDSTITHNPLAVFDGAGLMFDIIYDEYNNIPDIENRALFGDIKLSSMVHIISRPYMLRDYFAHNMNALASNKRGIQMLVPTFFTDLRAPSVALLVRLRERGMTGEEIVQWMSRFGCDEKNVENCLSIAVSEVLGDNHPFTVYNCFSFGEKETSSFIGSDYQYSRSIRLTNKVLYNSVIKSTEDNVRVTGTYEGLLPIPRVSVYNRYLRGQKISIDGTRYEIDMVGDGVIRVKNEETVEREKEYTAFFDLPKAILHDDVSKSYGKSEDFSRDIVKIDVTRSIKGYFSHINGLDFCGDSTLCYRMDQPIIESRSTECLRLRLAFPFGDDYDTSAALFVMLFRGILETVIPKNYQDIAVVSHIDKDSFREEWFDNSPQDAMRKDPLPSDWLETDYYDLPISQWFKKLFPVFDETNFERNGTDRINIYFIDFGDNGSHLLYTLAEEMTRMFNILYGYLDWTIKNTEYGHEYLKFGYNQIPAIFNLPTVYDCLKRIADHSPDKAGMLHERLMGFDASGSVRCSFCGRPVAVSYSKFDDDRIICSDCEKHRTTERKEINELLAKAYDTLESKYKIALPKGIKIRFKTANSIRKAGGVTPGSRVVGFYDLKHRVVWVERGGPAPCVLATLMHELTHAWQHENIDMTKLDKKFIEGHCVYVELECSRLLGQRVYADFWERMIESGKDEYSEGLRYWKERMKHESVKNIFQHIAKM